MGDSANDRLLRLLAKEGAKPHTHSLLVAIQSQDGSFDFRGAAGAATVESPYFIASITKMVTVAVLMQLVDEGALELDAPITEYLAPDLLDGLHSLNGVDYSRQLKVCQLIHQTSGLADYFEDKPKNGDSLLDELLAGQDRALDLAGVLAVARSIPPRFAPGAQGGRKSHYSDTNYQLLGAIIEALTGKIIADIFQTRVFDRLEMAQTYLYDCRRSRETPPLPLYHREQMLSIPLWMSSEKAAGGVVSTLADSLRFLRAYFGGELFDPRHFQRMQRQWNTIVVPVIQYAYGLMRFRMPRAMTLFRYSPELIGHSGASGSFAFFAPKEAVYMVGTFNQTDRPGRPFRFMLKALSAR